MRQPPPAYILARSIARLRLGARFARRVRTHAPVGVFQLADVANGPYTLDTLYGPGNGWTCDGVG